MAEAYLAITLCLVRCYDLKEQCVAGQGMPKCSIDAGTEVLLSIWDNVSRVAQGLLRRPTGPQTLVWMSLESLRIIGKDPSQCLGMPCPPISEQRESSDTTTEAAPMLTRQMSLIRHAHHSADGVAFYNDLQTALQDVHEISQAIPNNTQVEVLDRSNASYANVRWNGRRVQPVAPSPPALPTAFFATSGSCLLEVRHSNGQASVAWFYCATAALKDPNNYSGTIPNGEQVELINDNADGRHVFVTVRWRAQDVVMRSVHLHKLPVQLLNHDSQSQVAFFENVTAAHSNMPAGYLPNGTRATVDNANLDGNYILAFVNLPMGPRIVRSVDLQGLPQRNYTTPAGARTPSAPATQAGPFQHPSEPSMPAQVAHPMPSQVVQAQQPEILLYSEVVVRNVEGNPLVSYFLEKTSAELHGPADGSIPSNSTALLVELDTPSRGAGGYCKIKWKQNGNPFDVYVSRAHIFAA